MCLTGNGGVTHWECTSSLESLSSVEAQHFGPRIGIARWREASCKFECVAPFIYLVGHSRKATIIPKEASAEESALERT